MIDFAVWDGLLHQYVDLQGRVDYQAWKVQHPQTLTRWLTDLEQLDLDPAPTPEQQLALWINLYNAFTVSTILERYPIASIRPSIFGIPNWLAFLWFFQRRVYRVGHQTYSLAQIENQMLRDRLQEPRIHFAIVCASLGCPLLRSEAYTPEKVTRQLEEDAARFISNSDKVRYDAQAGILYCSKIFKWYQQDFLAVSPSIPDYVRSFLQPDLPLSASTPIVYLYYDWSLNQRMSS
ncbi:MAG: DUF547 domain-containing protein [Timaviella obliquedivisa GSE-PSE-MK23-08B]|jgi:hypothetical protein|nr:DUF547 domain-containing protein [Timaviella obliquedivisa GSE-PSE-MK23-08B]